jgi:hypothetical protein
MGEVDGGQSAKRQADDAEDGVRFGSLVSILLAALYLFSLGHPKDATQVGRW